MAGLDRRGETATLKQSHLVPALIAGDAAARDAVNLQRAECRLSVERVEIVSVGISVGRVS
jgi:hypothetical protein